jgi:hypothetical protein
MVGHEGRERVTHRGAASVGEHGERRLEVRLLLGATETCLVDQDDLGHEVADVVGGNPGDVLDAGDVVGEKLVGPQSVGVSGISRIQGCSALARNQSWLPGSSTVVEWSPRRVQDAADVVPDCQRPS